MSRYRTNNSTDAVVCLNKVFIMDRRVSAVDEYHFEIETLQVGEVMIREKMAKKIWDESKRMWEIAAPAMLTAVSQFSIGFVTSAFVGHLGELELAAVSIVQNVIEGFVFGLMVCTHITNTKKIIDY